MTISKPLGWLPYGDEPYKRLSEEEKSASSATVAKSASMTPGYPQAKTDLEEMRDQDQGALKSFATPARQPIT